MKAQGVQVHRNVKNQWDRECDSARNNIHPNNKQKPEITNENTGKIACRYGQPG